MSVVDQKGRIFGKVNLLDLVVVLAVVAVVGRFGYSRFMKGKAAPAGQDKVIEVTVLFSNVRQPTLDELKVGTEIDDSKSNAVMGKIVAVRSEPANVIGIGPDGRLWQTKSDIAFDDFVTISGPGRISPNAIMLGGIEMKVGRFNDYKTATWAGSGVTWHLPAVK